IDRAARAGGPTIATAAAASAAGMLVLLLSPVPMVRGFGVLLVVGIAIALLCAFSAGAAVITLGPSARLEGAGERLGRSRLARAATIEWMSAYEAAVLERDGYSSARGCGKARLCPAFSLPDLFAGQASGQPHAGKLSSAQVGALLGAIPPYFSQAVITPDRRLATLAFGIRLMGLEDQQRLIEGMRGALHPPRGVSATLVGLPVLAAQSGSAVASRW